MQLILILLSALVLSLTSFPPPLVISKALRFLSGARCIIERNLCTPLLDKERRIRHPYLSIDRLLWVEHQRRI